MLKEKQGSLSGVSNWESTGAEVRGVRGNRLARNIPAAVRILAFTVQEIEDHGGEGWTKERCFYYECLLIFRTRDQYILTVR